jgi:thioesterase domain-containing protein
LTRQGSQVGLLALLDTRATCDVPWPIYARIMTPHLAHRARVHGKQLLTGPGNGRLDYLKEKFNWFKLYATRTRGNLPVRPATEVPRPAGSHEFEIDYFDAAVTRYRPEKYAGGVTLFAGQDAKHFRHAAFWKHFVSGRVQIHHVAGGHGSLISAPHVAEFARLFKQLLRQAEADASTAHRA